MGLALGMQIQTFKQSLRCSPPCYKTDKRRRSKASFSPLVSCFPTVSCVPPSSGARLAVQAMLSIAEILQPPCRATHGETVAPAPSLPPPGGDPGTEGDAPPTGPCALSSGPLFVSCTCPFYHLPPTHCLAPSRSALPIFSLFFLSCLPSHSPGCTPSNHYFPFFFLVFFSSRLHSLPSVLSALPPLDGRLPQEPP